MADDGSAANNMIKVGIHRFIVNDEADDIVGPFTPPGATVNVLDSTGFALIYNRFLTDNISLQLSAGYPPEFEVKGAGVIAGLNKVVTTTALNPSVFLNYHFLERSAAIRPYVGIGVNYTNFVREEASASLEGLLGPTRVSLSSFVAVAVTAGVDVRLGGPWTASISVSYLSTDTTATLVSGGIQRTMDVELDPVTVFVGLGYTF